MVVVVPIHEEASAVHAPWLSLRSVHSLVVIAPQMQMGVSKLVLVDGWLLVLLLSGVVTVTGAGEGD